MICQNGDRSWAGNYRGLRIDNGHGEIRRRGVLRSIRRRAIHRSRAKGKDCSRGRVATKGHTGRVVGGSYSVINVSRGQALFGGHGDVGWNSDNWRLRIDNGYEKVADDVFPAPSLAVQFTTVVPNWNTLPDARNVSATTIGSNGFLRNEVRQS